MALENPETYDRKIVVSGTVESVNLEYHRMILSLPDGGRITCAFRQEDEYRVRIAFADPENYGVRLEGWGYLSPDGTIQEVCNAESLTLHLKEKPGASPLSSIWDKLAKRVNSLSPDAVNQLPADGAEQHDHYLYGAAKKDAR